MNKLIIILALSGSSVIFPQSDSLRQEPLLQMLLEDLEIEEENQGELIAEYLENPVDVNRASVEELESVPILTESEIKIFSAFVIKKRPFKSKEELIRNLPFSYEKKEYLKYFITVYPADQFSFLEIPDVKFRSRVKSNYPSNRAYNSGKYSGNYFSLYNNLKVNYSNKFRFTFISDKDIGENNYLDFYSASLKIDKLLLDQIIIGDYIAEAGQGLSLWSPYSFGKGSYATLGINKNAKNLYPNSSSHENKFFRGAAFKHSVRNFNFSFFYSVKRIDASLNENHFRFYDIGYHRSETELQKKDNVGENAWGLNAGVTIPNFLIANINIFSVNYSIPLNFSDILSPKRRFSVASINYKLNYGSIFYTAEWAYDGKYLANLNSLYFDLDKSLRIINLFRHYPVNYYSPFAQGFGESSKTSNETGYYFGVEYKTKYGAINFYYDIFNFSSSTYASSFPSDGSEIMINIITRKFLGVRYSARIFSESKYSDYIYRNRITSAELQKNKYRISIDFTRRNLSLRTRFEYLSLKNIDAAVNEKGFYVYQDIGVKFSKTFYVNFRLTYFNTDSYNSRLYSYERDIFGVMTLPALYLRGYRWMFLIRYTPIKGIILEAKAVQNYKPELLTLGTGDSAVESNSQTFISMQIRTIF